MELSGNYDDSGSVSSACHDLTVSADFAEPGIAFPIIPLWFIYFRLSAGGIVVWSAASVSGMLCGLPVSGASGCIAANDRETIQ